MIAAVYHGRRDVRVESVPEPGPLRPHEVRLRVARGALCGTDASEFAYGPRMIPLESKHRGSGHVGPMIIGHEFVGRIAAVGSAVERLSVGQRVVPGAGMWCGTCKWCLAGRTNLCAEYYTLGLNAHGGMAPFVNVPEQMCFTVPEECSDDAASIAQPLAVALHAVRRGNVSAGDSLIVIGIGGIGLFLVAAARSLGALPIIGIDVSENRLNVAAALGVSACFDARKESLEDQVRAVVGGSGADVVIEASGTPSGLETAQRLVRRGGTIVMVGIQAEPRILDVADLTVREIDVIGTNAHVCMVDLPEALEVLKEPKLASLAIDRVVPLAAIVDEGLVPLAAGNVAGKVLLDLEDLGSGGTNREGLPI